jgi:hypothetical protein
MTTTRRKSASHSSHKSSKHHAGKHKSKPKRKMNEFFRMQASARNRNANSFVYKGATYKQHKLKRGDGKLVYYKKVSSKSKK